MWSRTFAGLLLGFLVAVGLGGCYAVLGPRAHDENLVIAVVAVFPLWVGAWSLAYVARSPARAWGWLALAAAGVHALLWTAKHLGWGGWPA